MHLGFTAKVGDGGSAGEEGRWGRACGCSMRRCRAERAGAGVFWNVCSAAVECCRVRVGRSKLVLWSAARAWRNSRTRLDPTGAAGRREVKGQRVATGAQSGCSWRENSSRTQERAA